MISDFEADPFKPERGGGEAPNDPETSGVSRNFTETELEICNKLRSTDNENGWFIKPDESIRGPATWAITDAINEQRRSSGQTISKATIERCMRELGRKELLEIAKEGSDSRIITNYRLTDTGIEAVDDYYKRMNSEE